MLFHSNDIRISDAQSCSKKRKTIYPYLSSLTLKAWESRLNASNHALTFTLIILTLTQKSTNWKISVNIIKLPKQNCLAKYGNSNGVRTFNCGWSRESCKKLYIFQGMSSHDKFYCWKQFADCCSWQMFINMFPYSQIVKQYQCTKTKTVCILNRTL